MLKYLIICADDFGQNQSICDGILHLANQSRLNAISSMVNEPLWREVYGDLLAIKAKPLLGLHLNFTSGKPLSSAWIQSFGQSFPSLVSLISLAYRRKLTEFEVNAEISAQIDAFSERMNFYPDFIDGHQHVHQLPIIRDLLVKHHQRSQMHGFIRSATCSLRQFFSFSGFPRAQWVAFLGGFRMRAILAHHRIAFNQSFSGFYPFAQAERYREYFKIFLKDIDSGGLIMCHPGARSNDSSDSLFLSRHHELNYFMSDDFICDLSDNAFELHFKSCA